MSNLPFPPVGNPGVRMTDQRILTAMGCYNGIEIQSISSYIDSTTTSLKLFAQKDGFPFRAGGESIQVSSDSDDDKLIGIGVHRVLVSGFDADYLPISEIILMNGKTAVNGVNSYVLVNSCLPISFGSNEAAWHEIYVSKQGATLTAGVPSDLDAMHHNYEGADRVANLLVPAGFSGYILGATATGIGQDHTLTVTRYDGDNNRTESQKLILPIGSLSLSSEMPGKISAKTILEFTIKGETSTGSASLIATMILTDNSIY